MKQAKKFSDIIERIEHLRTLLNLNKSRFSADIGMKPQTYNNFIGAQGSKPNVELIYGIVNKFGVNPMWLLNGAGPIFIDEMARQEYAGNAPEYSAAAGASASVQERGGEVPRALAPGTLEALKKELKTIEPLMQKVESQIKQAETTKMPLVDRLIGLLKRFYELDPVSAMEEFRETLKRIESRVTKKS
jgi:transcriptional regulator with XRE-family HTH domain